MDLDALDRDGWLVLREFVGRDLLDELRAAVDRLLQTEGDLAGSEFRQEPGARRLANLVDKGDVFRRIIAVPAVLECVARVLGPGFKLSSLNARAPKANHDVPQPLHCDAAAVPDELGNWVCNVIWMLDDFTEHNGATRLVPGSHRSGRLPHEALADPLAPHADEVLVTGEAGTVVVMNTHLWHGATANRTSGPRRAVHAFYCRRDKPQQQYQKRLLRPEVASALSSDLRWLLALDDPLNDALSAQFEGRSGFMK